MIRVARVTFDAGNVIFLAHQLLGDGQHGKSFEVSMSLHAVREIIREMESLPLPPSVPTVEV